MNNLRNINTTDYNIRTYLNKNQIMELLEKIDDNLEWARCILHDKDFNEDLTLKEPHTHIVLKLYKRTKASTILNLFKEYKDSQGKEINTHITKCINLNSSIKYLTHETKKAIQENKYKYDESEIYGIGVINTNNDDINVHIKIINEIKNNKRPLQLVQEYGMLIIKYYKNYIYLAECDKNYENNENIKKEYIEMRNEIKENIEYQNWKEKQKQLNIKDITLSEE